MSGTLVVAALIGLTQPEPSNPDALQWEELDEPEAPPPAPAPAPDEAPSADTPPAEATPEATEAPPTAEPPPAEPASAPPEAAPPTTPPEEPQTAVEFTPTPQERISTLQPPGGEDIPRKRKSLYGRLWAGPVIGGGRNAFAIGASATYFVVPWVGMGAELINVFSWDPIGSYYEFQFTPKVTLLALPTRRVSPIVWGGFGVDTFTKGYGTYGRWTTGGGLIMLLGRRLILTLGVDIDGRVPESRWNQTFTCGPVRSNCTIGIGPVIGISFPFG